MRYKNKKLVDVVTGKMTLAELNNEVARYMFDKQPDLLLITIERDDDLKGYRSTIYLTIKDFEKPVKYSKGVFDEEFKKWQENEAERVKNIKVTPPHARFNMKDYERWRKETQLFANND